jgi:hypothetical protein
LAGIAIDSALVYKTYRKYQTMPQKPERMVWMSRQVRRLENGELKSEHIGAAYAELTIDLTEVQLSEDVTLHITADYAKVRIYVNAEVDVKINGTVHFANAILKGVVADNQHAATTPYTLKIQHALNFAALEIEVFP